MGFEPIPSLNYRYEIDTDGTVRNVRTKRVLKAHDAGYHKDVYHFIVDSVEQHRSRANLLHEVHGIEPKRPKAPNVGTLIRKAGEAYAFPSMYAATKFLMKKVPYSYSAIRNKLTARKKEIYGWKIYYREPEQRKPVTVSQANSDYQLTRHNGLKHKKRTTSDKI